MHALPRSRTDRRPGWLLAAVALVLVSPLALGAQAGKVVFVAGSVTFESGNRPVHSGDPVSAGDTVVTAAGARAQLLMGDGARIALRSGSRFRIDAFELGAAVKSPAATTVAAATGRSISTLLKGGFRTVSGSIGKSDPTAYEVRVPVGTLGIRGTDYVAVFCRGDCADAPGLRPGEPVRDGLYLGVYSGAIVFRGGGLEMVVAAGEFVFIPVPDLKPERLQQRPAPTMGDGAGPLELAGGGNSSGDVRPTVKDHGLGSLNGRRGPAPAATDPVPPQSGTTLPVGGSVSGTPIDLTPGQLPLRHNSAYVTGPLPPVLSPGAAGAGAPLYAFGSATGGATVLPVVTDAGVAELRIGTAVASDLGFHAATGLRWGRWSGGTVDLVNAAAVSVPLPLGTGSVHWVVGTGYVGANPPVLPQSGTAVYTLVGGTRPTDGKGNVGTLGSLTLNADFGANAVTATIALTIANTNWTASGAGRIAGPATPAGQQFSGLFNAPQVGRPAQGGGGGQFSGFFSNAPGQTTGVPGGAGISYSLTSPTAGTVSGAAALAGK